VELDWRQAQFLGDLRVLDLPGIVERHPADQLSEVRRTGDGGAASECLEFDVRDGVGRFVDADLQLHHVATGWGADETGANVQVTFVHRADITRVRVVIEHFLVVATASIDDGGGAREDSDTAGGRGGGGDDTVEHFFLPVV